MSWVDNNIYLKQRSCSLIVFVSKMYKVNELLNNI